MDESRVATMHSVRGSGLDGGDGNGSGQAVAPGSCSSAIRSSPDRIHGVAAFWSFRSLCGFLASVHHCFVWSAPLLAVDVPEFYWEGSVAPRTLDTSGCSRPARAVFGWVR